MDLVRRLTQTFAPEHYALSLDIDRSRKRFSGVVTIEGISDGPEIVLHAKELTIESVAIDGRTANYKTGKNDELTLTGSDLSAGKHVAVVAFSGAITDQMHGMYPCYFKHDGEEKELIATQFESHHAREVFPCVDEPEAKATFDVTLTTEPDITVLGNMPIKTQSEESGRLVTSFERTPRMSSYLLAWAYGELHSITGKTRSGVEVGIWSTHAQPARSLDFALDIAVRTIDFFEEYFGVAYPLPKSDHIALPDFSSGAMENWGLITYRETTLLADPESTSISSKHRIAAVIAHELSHQWFGNLVTMRWWNNLWLNESFANLMEYIALDALHPEWNIWFEFAGYETVMSLRRDAIDGVQAVQVDVNHPDEISTLFDPAIVYAKGSRLLHMLERHIGAEAFRDGLRAYFKEHAYRNTEETDLWKAFSQSSGQDIESLMTPWISKPGYPVLRIEDGALTQERFFIGRHQSDETVWPVPLMGSVDGMPKMLEAASMPLELPVGSRLNHDDSAHFITKYPNTHLATLRNAVETGELEPIARLQLLHEQGLLARGGAQSSAELVALLSSYTNESTESVWDMIAVTIGELKKFVEGDDASEHALKSMVRTMVLPQYQRLGWNKVEGETEEDSKLRATILGLMVYSEDETVISEATAHYEAGIRSIDPELRGLVLTAVIRHSEIEDAFNDLAELYVSTSSAELQQDICAGLTSTKNQSQVERLLRMMKEPKQIRSQDVARWFVYLMRSRYTRDQAWRWMKDNWQWIETTFAGDKSYDDYPRYSASGLISRDHLADYEAFFKPLQDIVALKRAIELGILEIEARIDLIERDRDAVRAALLDH
jgi:aminopeptidase N